VILREEGVDRDVAVGVSLAADRRPVKVGVAVRPAAEDVPLGPVAVVELRFDLDLDPCSGRRPCVPRGDEFVEREGELVDAGRPGAVGIGARAVDAVGGVVGERIGVGVGAAQPARREGERAAREDGAAARRVGRAEREGLEVDGIRLRCERRGGGGEREAGGGRDGDEHLTDHRAIVSRPGQFVKGFVS
jgi:hypothetical protein